MEEAAEEVRISILRMAILGEFDRAHTGQTHQCAVTLEVGGNESLWHCEYTVGAHFFQTLKAWIEFILTRPPPPAPH